ncbi:MAG: nucleoside hydrolase [Myxococcota bacterium]
MAPTIPVILDSDIGTDIDDTWALALLLNCPELDLRLVSTTTGDTVYRAELVARLLDVAQRTDVAIGVGPRQAKTGGPQAGWLADYELSRYAGSILEDGVGAIVDCIMSADEPVSVICIGPASNVAAALEREPEIARRARFIGMHGSIRRGYAGSEETVAEYNAAQDADGLRRVLGAPWSTTLTPLDTCGLVTLKGEKYRAVLECEDPLTRAVIDNYRIWAPNVRWAGRLDPDRASSTLYDTVAVYLAFSEELLEIEPLGLRVTADGHMEIDHTAKETRCAVAWSELAGFEDLLVARLTDTEHSS